MLKVKISNPNRVKSYIFEYGENIFPFDGNILFCKICDVIVKYKKRFTVLQHFKTGKYVRGIEWRCQQQEIKNFCLLPTKINSFNKD